MIFEILTFLAVLGAQLIVYLLPTIIVARRLANNSSWIVIGWWALFIGISSQAILGLFWGHLVRHMPAIEAIVWLTGWLIATILCLARTSRPSSISLDNRQGFREYLILGAIIMVGILLRGLHPLQHWALGQSDAYSHLQFIQDVVEYGCIGNRMYPPGHAWVVSLPALIFNLDPYVMARYGGAFFGLCLILAVYVLVRTNTRTPTPALMSAFLVGCFPAFNILHKTSVGVFANQLGLFLVPSLLALFLLWRNTSFKWNAPFIGFSVGLAAMIVSTPIMLIHLVIVVGLERVATCFLNGRKALRSLFQISMAIVPAVFLMILHLGYANSRSVDFTIKILAPDAKPIASSSLQTKELSKTSAAPLNTRVMQILNTCADFFSVKRLGFHNWVLNTGGLTIFCIVMVCFVYGWRAHLPPLILLGLWGGLTSVQVFTGWLQFSFYQREGWSFIIAFIVAAGVTGGFIWDHHSRYIIVRVTAIAGLILTAVFGFLNPPGHSCFASSGEDDIVHWIKIVSQHCCPSGRWPVYRVYDPDQQKALDVIDQRFSPVLITRQMAGWSSGQGELARVIGRGMPTIVFELDSSKRPLLDHRRQYVMLIETGKVLDSHASESSVFMRKIQPEMVHSFARVLANENRYVREMEAFVAENSMRNWIISRAQLTPLLGAVILTPLRISVPPRLSTHHQY